MSARERDCKTLRRALARRMLLLITVLFALAPAVAAQYAGSFARMGLGARSMALGGGLVADVSGFASPYHNPALAPYAGVQHIEGTFGFLSVGRHVESLQVVAPLRPRAGFAMGIVHAGTKDLDGRDASGYHTGTFSTDEYAFFLAFGARLSEAVSIGGGFRLYRAELFERLRPRNSLALQMGMLIRPSERLSLGVSVDDLLARYSWDTSELLGGAGGQTTDRFPVRVRTGASYAIGRARLLSEVETQIQFAQTRTRVAGTVGGESVELTEREDLQFLNARLKLGGEMSIIPAFSARVGLDGIGSEVAGIRPSAGFSLREQLGELDAQLDYAAVLEPYGSGVMHAISIRLNL